MKTLPAGLAAHLASGTTTICQCWKLTRTDGVVQGFTDHDRQITFDGTTFAAATGLEASEAVAQTGFAVGGMEVAGAIGSDNLEEQDLASGVYDSATVEVWLVNWGSPDERLKTRIGQLGEIKRTDGAFLAEIRGSSHRLDQTKGRVYAHFCDALLGDIQCGINLADAAYAGDGSIIQVDGDETILVTGLSGFDEGWFTYGQLTWTSGDNSERSVEVRYHGVSGAKTRLQLFQAPGRAMQIGDEFDITAGCDKAFATCRTKFANAVNFRGFPHMPGDDFTLTYPQRDNAKNDGSKLVD